MDPSVPGPSSVMEGGLGSGSPAVVSQRPGQPSRYETQKRRDWNTFLQYLRNHRPPLAMAQCRGAHVLEFLRYLDQIRKTKVHVAMCAYYGLPSPPAPCQCPLREAWGTLDSLVGRLRAAYEENGGTPESNPFAARDVRIYLREVRDSRAVARGICNEENKKKRKRSQRTATAVEHASSSAGPAARQACQRREDLPPRAAPLTGHGARDPHREEEAQSHADGGQSRRACGLVSCSRRRRRRRPASMRASVYSPLYAFRHSGAGEMSASVSALHGPIGPLIWKLKVLLLEACDGNPESWPRLPKEVKDGIDLLKDDLEEICASLEDLSELEDPPLTAKCWMKEVRELSYDIEDYLDILEIPCSRTRTKIKTTSVYKISRFQLNRFPKRKKLTWDKEVKVKISEFRIRAQEANERHKRYELDRLDNLRRRYAPSGPMLPWHYDEAADLVIDDQMNDVMDILACDRDHHLRVVSIVGPGGLGKTTFTKVLYNKIRGQFDCHAFVSMTRKPIIRNVLCEILKQIQRHEAHDYCEDLDIIGRIKKRLHGKRYLIVIDYLWDALTWNMISPAFPEDGHHSRIIITTQVEDVAVTCCYQTDFVFQMKPLDVYHSRKLFFNRIFSFKSGCPEIFKKVSYKIVDMCRGLPLATASMASLLGSNPMPLMEQWVYISDSLGTMLQRSSTSEGLRQVLELSYNNLSHCLKSCLLYLSMYPEGCIICKDDLVKQWMAEGFIDAIEGRDMESVATSYFDELIDRRFILPTCIKYNNEIVSCVVHDTVYDLIAYNSAEENFVMVVDANRKNVELIDKVRRLSLNFCDAMYAKISKYIRPSHVRSLAFFGFFACMPPITEFKLLRVLNLRLHGYCGDEILNLAWISELFQLRYLKVVSDVCIELPKHMRGLHHLETLDLDAKVTAFSWDIIHLPSLLNLHCPFDTNLIDWISNMESDVVRGLDKLTNLRDIRLTCSTAPPNQLERNMEVLSTLLRGLGNLKILVLVPGCSHDNTVTKINGPSEAVVSWDGFIPPLHLKRFEWSLYSCIFSRVPKWIVESGNLCVLKIVVKELLRDGVDILKGLPALKALSLYVHSSPVERIVFDKVGFSALKFFKIRCSVPWLKFEEDAMQNLLKLKLGFNANRVGQHRKILPIIIEHLPCLKQIYVKIGGAGTDAESALTAAVINHPSNPTINIQLVDWMFPSYEVRECFLQSNVPFEENDRLYAMQSNLDHHYSSSDEGSQRISSSNTREFEAQYYTLESPAGSGVYPAESSTSSHNISCITEGPMSQHDSHSDHTYIAPSSASCLTEAADLQVKLKELENALLGPELDISSDSPESFLQTNVPLRAYNWTQSLGIDTGDLKQVIIACGKAVAENNTFLTDLLISKLGQLVSVSGDPMQRVGAYMLEGIIARLSCSGSMLYKSLKCKEPTSSELMSYMTLLHEICPLNKFGYMSASGTIAGAIKGENIVHIIDFQIAQGSQWIILMQALAKRLGGPPCIRITGIDDSNSAYARGGGLDFVHTRLYNVAQSIGLPFEFNAIPVASHEVELEHLDMRPGEVIAVNFAYQLHKVPDESVSTENDRDRIIRMIKSINPRVVTLVEQESNTSTAPFFTRYMETLDYYTAMFEAIDVARPRDDKRRINAERHCVATDIVNLIACEGAERVERHELFGKWKARFSMAGFRPYPLSSVVTNAMNALLQNYHSYYRLEERDGVLYLGWKYRVLVVSSAWC